MNELHQLGISRILEKFPQAQTERFRKRVMRSIQGKCRHVEVCDIGVRCNCSCKFGDQFECRCHVECCECDVVETIQNLRNIVPDAFIIESDSERGLVQIVAYEVEYACKLNKDRLVSYLDWWWAIDDTSNHDLGLVLVVMNRLGDFNSYVVDLPTLAAQNYADTDENIVLKENLVLKPRI